MLYANRHPQGRLPIAVQLVPTEIEIPARNTVELAEHAGTPVLMRRGLRLLSRGQLKLGAQHVNARQLKAAVGAHSLAQRRRLALQRRLLHHVPCQHQVMLLAPLAALVRKGLCKTFCDMVMIVVPNH